MICCHSLAGVAPGEVPKAEATELAPVAFGGTGGRASSERGLKPTLLTDSRLGQARGPDLLSYFSIRVLGVFDKWLILQDRLLVTG